MDRVRSCDLTGFLDQRARIYLTTLLLPAATLLLVKPACAGTAPPRRHDGGEFRVWIRATIARGYDDQRVGLDDFVLGVVVDEKLGPPSMPMAILWDPHLESRNRACGSGSNAGGGTAQRRFGGGRGQVVLTDAVVGGEVDVQPAGGGGVETVHALVLG